MANIYYKNGSSWTSFLSIVYPVVSIYLTINYTIPANLVGGTWSELKGRYYLRSYTGTDIGYDDPGTTGGTNYITISNLPSHTHTISSSGAHRHSVYYSVNGTRSGAYWQANTEAGADGTTTSYMESSGAHTHTVNATGGGDIYLPAYYVVHIWRRTA